MAARKPRQAPKLSAFISHAKADAKKAQEIAASLEERGLKCWIAPRDVTAGRAYGDEIIRGIESAKAFVLVLSKSSNGSSFVAREVERAVSKQKPIFVVRLGNIEPAPALELFISGTQWIDAFPGKFAPHIGRLAKLLGEEGEGEPPGPEPDGTDVGPRRIPAWAWPAGAAAALFLAIGAGFALWPGHHQNAGDGDPSLLTWPAWLGNQEITTQKRTAADDEPIENDTPLGAKAPGTVTAASDLSVGDPDFRACEKSSGDDGIAACDRAIASGKFTGRSLSYLYSDRGFMRMQKVEIEAALADLNQAAAIDPTNFYAFWNRGAVRMAQGDFVSAQTDFNKALSLEPDQTSKAKIEEALNVVTATLDTANAKSDKTVITDPTIFGGEQPGNASAESNLSVDAMPSLTPTLPGSMPASPSYAIEAPPMGVEPVMPASPAQIPVR